MDLTGDWTLRNDAEAIAVPFSLPGDGVTALHKAGVIADPYWGQNEYDLRWIAGRDWMASRSFDHDGAAADLIVEGLDTVAEIRLNGVLVLQAANAFRRWRVPVSEAVKPGRNEIEILFRSPVEQAAKRQAEQPFYIPYSLGNCPIPDGNMLRKPQCDFGWDWNIALPSFGVWGGIALESAGPRFGDVIVSQEFDGDAVEVFLKVEAPGPQVTARLCGVQVTADVHAGRAELTLRVEKPALWWPVGQGPQTLHLLELSSGAATTTRRLGLRDLSLQAAPDAVGRSFGFCVNGRPVFARGANWIPADALHGRITPDLVRDLLQSAVDANMNMIRIWGGGRYEPDWFYDLCDELGLMVWQDFMFACHLYPSTPEFLAEVDAEVRDVVGRLNHHACLALWCGDNELIGALSWYQESRKDRDRYLVNYDRLNRCIETSLHSVLPKANWWPSSPSPGPLAFGDAWHDDSSGDMHFWSVWHEGRDFDHYRDVKPRFCSEFGFQSYPSMPVIRRFADEKDWNIAAPVMESHQKNAGGNARIAETMFRYFRFPVDFPSFVYLSQVQQGMAIHTAVTAWRALKPHCMGALYWQLNDTWPVCSWSSLDHGGGWKLLHHMAQDFYAPVTVVVVPEDGRLVLRAVNDTPVQTTLTVKAWAAAMSGHRRLLEQVEIAVTTDAALEVLSVPSGTLAAQEILVFEWSDATSPANCGTGHFAPRPWKAYDLLPANLAAEVVAQAGGVYRITLSAQALALFAAVEADVAGRFSANAFTLFPGEPRVVTFTPADPSSQPRFTYRDLHSATYAVHS